jgi:multiple sugar transport system substrate-binding protein
MTTRLETFRIAVRKFGPFEKSIVRQWESFCARSGCRLRLETVALDLHPLHATLFEDGGLKSGHWDAAFVVTDWLAEAFETGALLDLAPRLSKSPPDSYPTGWTESLLRAQRFDNVVLGLPYHDGPMCLIYRTDLLERAGANPPQNWEEYHKLARALSVPSNNLWGTVFAAFPDGHNTVYDFCLQLWTRGGELFGGDGRLLLNQPAAHAGLACYRSLLADMAAVHPQCGKFDSVQSGFAFARGEVAMMVNWFGFAAMCETLEDSRVKGRVGIAPIPSGPGGSSASLNVYWLLGVGAGSPHQLTAQAFLAHCASKENDKLLTLEGGIGCRRSTWHDSEVNSLIPFYSSLEGIHDRARELPRLGNWSRLAEIIDRLMTATMATNTPVEELAAQAQREADQMLDQV